MRVLVCIMLLVSNMSVCQNSDSIKGNTILVFYSKKLGRQRIKIWNQNGDLVFRGKVKKSNFHDSVRKSNHAYRNVLNVLNSDFKNKNLIIQIGCTKMSIYVLKRYLRFDYRNGEIIFEQKDRIGLLI